MTALAEVVPASAAEELFRRVATSRPECAPTALHVVREPTPAAGMPVPPPALNAKHQEMLTAVQGAPDFDAAYVNTQLMAHQEAVALFTSYSSSGDVPQLASFAGQTLPTLQMHLDHAQALSGGAARAM